MNLFTRKTAALFSYYLNLINWRTHNCYSRIIDSLEIINSLINTEKTKNKH